MVSAVGPVSALGRPASQNGTLTNAVVSAFASPRPGRSAAGCGGSRVLVVVGHDDRDAGGLGLLHRRDDQRQSSALREDDRVDKRGDHLVDARRPLVRRALVGVLRPTRLRTSGRTAAAALSTEVTYGTALVTGITKVALPLTLDMSKRKRVQHELRYGGRRCDLLLGVGHPGGGGIRCGRRRRATGGCERWSWRTVAATRRPRVRPTQRRPPQARTQRA